MLEKADGTMTDPGEETITELVRVHFPYSDPIRHLKYNSAKNTPTALIQSEFSGWINGDRAKLAMAGFEKKKSPGPDNLKPVLFEHLDTDMIEFLVTIFKATIYLAYTPKLWRETKIIFIPKPCLLYTSPSPRDS